MAIRVENRNLNKHKARISLLQKKKYQITMVLPAFVGNIDSSFNTFCILLVM
jgi:hypothetical protein